MNLAYLVGLITFLGHFFGMPPSLVLSQPTRLGSLWVQGRPRAQQHRRTAGFLLGLLVGYAYKILPIEAIIATPFFHLLGGNVNVATANIHAIIANVSKDPSQRTIIFTSTPLAKSTCCSIQP